MNKYVSAETKKQQSQMTVAFRLLFRFKLVQWST